MAFMINPSLAPNARGNVKEIWPGFSQTPVVINDREKQFQDGAKERLPLRLTKRGKMVAWLAAISLGSGLTVAAAENAAEHEKYDSALTQPARVVASEIGQGQINPADVTLYPVRKTEDAYNVASDAEGHPVSSSDPVIGETLAQTGHNENDTRIPQGTVVVLQRDVVAGNPPSLEQTANYGK